MKNFYSILFLTCYIALCNLALAQEYKQWVYGYHHMDFETEPPTLKFNDSLGSFFFPASICDESGKLLFYTVSGEYRRSGMKIYNGNNEPIVQDFTSWPNCPMGFANSYYSLFVKANDSLFYYFYVSSYKLSVLSDSAKELPILTDSVGLYYTLINKNLHNGTGGVVPGFQDVRINNAPCTGITTHKNADGTSWIVTRYNGNYFAYKINGALISPPVVSSFTEKSDHTDVLNIVPEIQKLCFSNDGLFMASASDFFLSFPYAKVYERLLYAYQFNPNDGKFTNQKVLISEHSNTPLADIGDVVFSPNDSLFYTLSHKGCSQYERYSDDIKQSKVVISDKISCQYGCIGENQKIYIYDNNRWSAVGIINRPDLKGEKAMLIADHLPPVKFPQRPPFTRYHGLRIKYSTRSLCDGSLQMENLCDTTKFVSYSWYIYAADGSAYADSSTNFAPVFQPPADGNYFVKIRAFTPKGYGPWYSDTAHFKALSKPVVAFNILDSVACRFAQFRVEDKTVMGKINPATGASWQWKFGEDTDTTVYGQNGSFNYVFNTTGLFSIKLLVSNGYCQDSIEKKGLVKVIDAPKPGINADILSGCQPLKVQIQRKFADTIVSVRYTFSDGSSEVFPPIVDSVSASISHTFFIPGVNSVYQWLEGTTGCITLDSVNINVLQGFEDNEKPLIGLVTVNGDTEIAIAREDNIMAANKYVIQRSDDLLRWDSTENPGLNVMDNLVNTQKHVYYYRLKAFDTCAAEIYSETSNSILLNASNYDNAYSIMDWNAYNNWPDGVSDYEIQVQNAVGLWETVNATMSLNFLDENFLVEGGKEKCYRVMAKAKSTGLASVSNTVCVPFHPVIWIPTAFSPNNDGLNETFIISTLGIESFYLEIYNSFGQLIYSGTQTSPPWTGFYKGAKCPEGVYLYTYRARTAAHRIISKQGNITLLR